MGKKIRVRCPICGMLVWQSRLNKDFPFEFVLQEVSGRGYKQIENKYKKLRLPDSEGSRIFCTMLALKMAEKAKQMLKRVGGDEMLEINVRWLVDGDDDDYLDDVDDTSDEPGDVEFEPETHTYEFEVDGRDYEIEIPLVTTGEVRGRSFLGRLFSRTQSDGEVIPEMEKAVDSLEREFDSFDVEVISDVDSEFVSEEVSING